jgi:putative ATPase
MPECRINLAHLVAYLSEAPKSTRSYEAYNRAEDAAKLDLTIPVPLQMRNAPTDLSECRPHLVMKPTLTSAFIVKELGYARGYAYNPNYA